MLWISLFRRDHILIEDEDDQQEAELEEENFNTFSLYVGFKAIGNLNVQK